MQGPYVEAYQETSDTSAYMGQGPSLHLQRTSPDVMRTSLYIEIGFLNVDRTSLNIERASKWTPMQTELAACRQNWQHAEAKSEFDGKLVKDICIMAQGYSQNTLQVAFYHIADSRQYENRRCDNKYIYPDCRLNKSQL